MSATPAPSSPQFLHIDDTILAIDAIASIEQLDGDIFSIGSPEPGKLRVTMINGESFDFTEGDGSHQIWEWFVNHRSLTVTIATE